MPKTKVVPVVNVNYPAPDQRLTLIDKRLVLNAIIDAVSRMPGFSIMPQEPEVLRTRSIQPPDDPDPGFNVFQPAGKKRVPGWPKGKPRVFKKPTGAAAHKKNQKPKKS